MLKAMWGFGHIPASLAVGNLTGVSNYADYPVSEDHLDDWSTPLTTGQTGIVVDSEGTWLAQTLSAAASGGGRGFQIPVASVQDLGSRASYMGYRFKCTAAVAAAAAAHILSISNGQNANGNFLLSILSAAAPLTFAANTSIFIEHKFDRVLNTISTWVNNTLISVAAYNAGAILPGTWFVLGHNGGAPNTTGGAMQFLFKDFYFVDDTQDANLPNGRIGAVSHLQQTQASAAAPNSDWTSSDSTTLLADLLSPVTTTVGTWTAPVVTSGPVNTTGELDVGFSNAVTAGNAVRAASFIASAAQSAGGATAVMNTEIDDTASNVEKLSGFVFPDPSMHLGVTLGAAAAAPDGGVWTPSKLSGILLKVKPTLIGATTSFQPLAQAIPVNTFVAIKISAATTVTALIPQINAALGTNITAADLVNKPVRSGALSLMLVAASTSIQFAPGSSTTVTLLGNATVLMHFDGASAQTTTTDDCGSIVTMTGATLSTAHQKFGTTSLSVPNQSSWAAIPNGPRVQFLGDWTIEGWVWITTSSDSILCDKSPTATATQQQRAYIELNAGTLLVKEDGTAASVGLGAAAIGTAGWVHVAVVKHGTIVTGFVNGAPGSAPITSQGTWGVNTGFLAIGNNTRVNGAEVQGFIDDFRMSNIARYTGAFTPQATAFIRD